MLWLGVFLAVGSNTSVRGIATSAGLMAGLLPQLLCIMVHSRYVPTCLHGGLAALLLPVCTLFQVDAICALRCHPCTRALKIAKHHACITAVDLPELWLPVKCIMYWCCVHTLVKLWEWHACLHPGRPHHPLLQRLS
jgi:hypothetical protein